MSVDTAFDWSETDDDFELDIGQAAAEGAQYITFQVADEEYGIDIQRIQEIIRYRVLTRIPNSPDFVLGVLNLRGVVVPVIDLRCRFHMDRRETDKRTVIVVVEVQGRVMGLVVDSVNDVVAFEEDGVKPPPSFSSSIRTDFIEGMGESDGKFIVLLAIDRLLTVTEMAEVDAAA